MSAIPRIVLPKEGGPTETKWPSRVSFSRKSCVPLPSSPAPWPARVSVVTSSSTSSFPSGRRSLRLHGRLLCEGDRAAPPQVGHTVINDLQDCYMRACDPSSGYLLTATKCPPHGSQRPPHSCLKTKASLAASLAVRPGPAWQRDGATPSVSVSMHVARAFEEQCARMFATASNAGDGGLSCLMPRHRGRAVGHSPPCPFHPHGHVRFKLYL